MLAPEPAEHRIALGDYTYELTRHREPLVTVRAGDVVTLETEDAFSGQIRKAGDRRDRRARPFGNPVVGPIVIDGSEPGDTISLAIEAIDPLRDECATYIPRLPYIEEHLGPSFRDQTRVLQISHGQMSWDSRLSIPYSPLLGVVGCSPANGAPSSGAAGDHGGNLDLKEITIGASVELPVFVNGGYVYVGDCHAAQGDGEAAKVALEMAAVLRFRVGLNRRTIPGPRILTQSEIAAVAIGRNLEEAISTAFGRLAVWIEDDFGIDRWEAYSLTSAIASLSIGYFGLGVVAAKFPIAYLGESSAVAPEQTNP